MHGDQRRVSREPRNRVSARNPVSKRAALRNRAEGAKEPVSPLAKDSVSDHLALSLFRSLAPSSVLLLLILLAFALRVHNLAGQSLWYDEAVTARVSSQGIGELTRWTADDIQPPLYYYIVAGWIRLAGNGEWALRFPSVFFGTLTVPLLWAIAGRLFGRGRTGRMAAVLAAFFAAVSPLYLYYAQEARMYTLLTFLGLLTGYALLRALGADGRRTKDEGRWTTDGRAAKGETGGLGETGFLPPSARFLKPRVFGETRFLKGRGWWVVTVGAAAAMLYTHYFGAFLLAAYAGCVLVAWAAAGLRLGRHRPALRSAALAGVAVFLLYLPWLPAMLNRYQVDRSYWQGALKLNEALRHVAISFTAGAPQTMLEGQALRLLPWYALAFGASLLALLVWAQRSRHLWAPASLLFVIVGPLAGILALASRTPKFNARYLMLVSPAYLLLLAGGIAAIVGLWRGKRRWLGIAGAGLALFFIVATSAMGIHNWFTDPAFTKAQWREAVAAVRQEMQPGEALLLVSGHAAPAWAYYAPEIPAIRLPDLDILDVDAVLGFESGPVLEQSLAGHSGVWLLQWQEEAADPAGFVPYFLDRAGEETEPDRQFSQLQLRHWRLNPDASYPAEPQPMHTDGANFEHKLALLGWDDPQNGQIIVYWRVLNTLERDYRVSLVVEDTAGRELGRSDVRPAGYDYPTTRWQPGQTLFGRYPLPLPPGAAPDDYYITLAVYDESDPTGLDIIDVADNPAGKRVRLGPMNQGF